MEKKTKSYVSPDCEIVELHEMEIICSSTELDFTEQDMNGFVS